MTEQWNSYGAFRFTREKVMWVLQNRSSFEKGEWPPEPIVSGYTENKIGKKDVKAEASFVKPAS